MKKQLRDRIADRAYAIWQHEGRPDGHDLDHWLRAEAEVRAAEKPAKKKPLRPAKSLSGTIRIN